MVSSRTVFNIFQICSIEAATVLNAFSLADNTHSISFWTVCSFSFQLQSLEENDVFSCSSQVRSLCCGTHSWLGITLMFLIIFRLRFLKRMKSMKVYPMTKSLVPVKSSTLSLSALRSPYSLPPWTPSYPTASLTISPFQSPHEITISLSGSLEMIVCRQS